jgi:two-component system OmpR family sensor kinase/two-component system sensor histidine kinase BaeS
MQGMMRNSLIFKLMGAFLLVILAGALVIAALTSNATRSAFNLYTTRSGQIWAQRLAPDLANFFAKTSSWQGVDEFLNSQNFPMGMGAGMGHSVGQGRNTNGNGLGSSLSPMAAMEQRLILADDTGFVISDTQGNLFGKQIPAAELKDGTPISVNDRVVGTLIITLADTSAGDSLAGDFLDTVNRSILSSAVIAILIALILGAGLFLQITAPLRQLKKAASAIASGDFRRRVEIRTSDELGDLGMTFNSMAENLESNEIQRRHLVADVAHELRTPLAAIQGTLEAIHDGVLPADEEQIAAVYSQTMLLNRLIDDLKVLSLADSGQLKLEKHGVQPRELILQFVDRFRPQADQKGIQMEILLSDNLPEVWMDSDRIMQVINNLIGNALRYTPAGGSINTEVGYDGTTNSLEISVSDTGQGIDPIDLPHIFDRFYRADKSRTRSSGGSGLGLAIARQLVVAHGGNIFAESPIIPEGHPDHGTKVTFSLPVNNIHPG